jgi:hypothetical protein
VTAGALSIATAMVALQFIGMLALDLPSTRGRFTIRDASCARGRETTGRWHAPIRSPRDTTLLAATMMNNNM